MRMFCDSDDPPMPDLIEENDDDSDASEEEVEFTDTPCRDLFSDKKFPTARECIQYCKDVHGFDLQILSKRFSLDCFSFIRMVNYIRSEKPSPGLVMSLASTDLWNDQKYMKPVLEDDPLLMYDIESDENDLDTSETIDQSRFRSFENRLDSTESTELETGENVEELKNTIDILKARLAEKDLEVDQLMTDIVRMRSITQSIIDNEDREKNRPKGVGDARSEADDSYYASSYSHFGIHHEMLSDRSRTEAYRDAIKLNHEQISGKYVLDLGCGTGILSMFCADLGKASRVVGVDMSEVIHYAMDIVRENGLDERITLLKGRLEDLNLEPYLPESGKFDVLVSEWMGYFLLFEGMLDSLIHTRDNFLKKGGLILPNRFTMHLVGVGDPKRYGESVEFWKDVYGYKMSCMKQPSISEASVETVPINSLITEAVQIHELDVTVCTLADTEFVAEFSLKVTSDGFLSSIAGYFDSFFDQESLENKEVILSTGPAAQYSHWKQTVFYLEEKLTVKKDSVLVGKIEVSRAPKNIRGLHVVLTIEGRSQSYSIE